jgi:hypothetical protein
MEESKEHDQKENEEEVKFSCLIANDEPIQLMILQKMFQMHEF